MSPRGRRIRPLLLPALAALALGSAPAPAPAPAGAAGGSVRIRIEPPEAPPPGAAGVLRVAGRFDHPAFAVDDVGQMAVFAGGKILPLAIESPSMVREWGRVVSARIGFSVERAALEAEGFELTLSWGPDVRGLSTLVERIPDEGAAGFGWERGGGESVASIVVIAQSGAERHYLWYLLPMALLLALLTARKIFST